MPDKGAIEWHGYEPLLTLKQPAVGKVCPKVYPNKAEPHEVPDKGALRCVTLAYP